MRRCLVALILAAVVLCSGCAVLNPANRRTYNHVRNSLVPRYQEPTLGQYCVLVPAALVAVTLDTFIVHPAMVLDDAWRDTASLLWTDFDWEAHYVTECAKLPFRTILTPVVYLPTWLVHSIFDVEWESEPVVPPPAPPAP